MKKSIFLNKAAKNDWSKKSGEWFITEDKFNNNYKVRIVVDNEIKLNTARKTKDEAIKLRDLKIKELVSEYTPSKSTKKAAAFIDKLKAIKKQDKTFVYYDKFSDNYKINIALTGGKYLYTTRKKLKDAINLRNSMIPTIISQIQNNYGLA